MKIEIWSDFVCPFCYIGKARLEKVLKALNIEAEIEMKSFELDPYSHPAEGISVDEQLANKYGISLEQAHENNKQIAMMAAEEGLTFNFSIMKNANTFLAHKVFQYAKTIGKGNEVTKAFLKAVFEDGIYLDSEENITKLVEPLGIDAQTVHEVLHTEKYGTDVRGDEEMAYNLGVQGVPYFKIDNSVIVAGAKSDDDFRQALLYAKSQSSEDDVTCTDDGCRI